MCSRFDRFEILYSLKLLTNIATAYLTNTPGCRWSVRSALHRQTGMRGDHSQQPPILGLFQCNPDNYYNAWQ